ncbi:hypothetical protein [Geodermatophilus sp. DSM 44513]|uniref:hypothetical protein n=1 Tax=Geodermatophilus sp. DSM 44513 TaxID=1528104 RepID=UPI00126FDDD9|nr:hypothetical protein [Geodermatophilus sp. DSM 44513]WNV75729.1 hypothetical protein RTG05_00280 [Geodermatophilus sp. DSM 44513]
MTDAAEQAEGEAPTTTVPGTTGVLAEGPTDRGGRGPDEEVGAPDHLVAATGSPVDPPAVG